MSKKVLFRVGLAAIGVIVAVFWLLSLVLPNVFGQFNLSIAIAIFSGLAGVLYILKGVFGKNLVPIKKFSIIFGALLLVVCLISIAGAVALPKNYILPIIAIIMTGAILLGVLAVGGKKWDEADNKKVGYKNYHQRKAEEEKKNKDNE